VFLSNACLKLTSLNNTFPSYALECEDRLSLNLQSSGYSSQKSLPLFKRNKMVVGLIFSPKLNTSYGCKQELK